MILYLGLHYHSQRQVADIRPEANIAVMPLFHEKSQSLSMIKHGMNIVRDVTQYLSPGQLPVIAMDQPLYKANSVVITRHTRRRQVLCYDGRLAYRDGRPPYPRAMAGR